MILIGILVYPLGLELSLNSEWLVGNQQSYSNFQVLNALSGSLGNSYFGLFSSGTGTQQLPAMSFRGELFFPNVTMYYMSYLSDGFFTAIIGVVLLALA